MTSTATPAGPPVALDRLVGPLSVSEIKAAVLQITADGKPFRLSTIQRRCTYRHPDGHLLCAVGYNDVFQALDEMEAAGQLTRTERDHNGFKTYVANKKAEGLR